MKRRNYSHCVPLRVRAEATCYLGAGLALPWELAFQSGVSLAPWLECSISKAKIFLIFPLFSPKGGQTSLSVFATSPAGQIMRHE